MWVKEAWSACNCRWVFVRASCNAPGVTRRATAQPACSPACAAGAGCSASATQRYAIRRHRSLDQLAC
eukprot:2720222-Prymnesium_polylepis.1